MFSSRYDSVMIRTQHLLCKTDQVRSLEEGAIAGGRTAEALMETAGRAAFRALRQRWPHAQFITVYCGKGNNGGDGYVLARIAQDSGLSVRLVSLGDPTTAEAAAAKHRALSAGLVAERHSNELLNETEVVVDALLGIGVSGNLREPMASIVSDINQSSPSCLSLDIPSGLNADTGSAVGGAVSAEMTVTFIRNKPGLMTGEGPDYAGRVILEDLQVFDRLDIDQPLSTAWGFCLDESWVSQNMPLRRNSAHKGNAGHVLVVGGGPGMPGAPVLAGCAALRMGAGRVSIACHPDSLPAASFCPELMVKAVKDTEDLSRLLPDTDVVVIGPGLGQTVWAKAMYGVCVENTGRKVIDADALNLLARDPRTLALSVLTPHPGEAGRLAALSPKEVQVSRPEVSETLAEKFNATCVLKGAGTLVARPGHPVMLCDRGHSGMATPGMGDVLSGIIGALMAQGAPEHVAAGAGVWCHAVAAERAGAAAGRLGMCASDLNPYLRELRSEIPLRQYRHGR